MSETAIKERPILFSGEMVRAILDGRKTQTRRVVNPQPLHDCFEVCHFHKTCVDKDGNLYPSCEEYFGISDADGEWATKCPYGEVGDRLWVREAWHEFPNPAGRKPGDPACMYRATSSPNALWKWKPSIHMPRWASRITLEMTGVRVERLNDISEEDAKAEGVSVDGIGNPGGPMRVHQRAFKILWESINGAGSWDANPWVWILEFRKVT